jgi:hypothetical protein
MRELIDVITLKETALSPGELSKHGGKYLEVLIELIGTGVPIAVEPAYRATLGDAVEVDPSIIPVLQKALADPENIKSNLPKTLPLTNGQSITFSKLFKGPEFTGLKVKKNYNTGHLAELFMGLAVYTKFSKLGKEISVQDILETFNSLEQGIQKSSYTFNVSVDVQYPDPASKVDHVVFRAVVPGKSSQEFINQANTGNITADLMAVLNSATLYANQSAGVANACQRVREDLGSNNIEIVSDGTSDAKGTKADLILKIDGSKINLLSLKTDSATLGQYSGLEFENVQKFFNVGLGIDIIQYRELLDPTLSKDKLLKNLFKIYDDVVYPEVKKMVENQSPKSEVSIVRRLARGANIFARGEALENVDIVKLDDSIKSGNYKVMRYSDSLYEAMRELDLDTEYIKGPNSRTIKIIVKPSASASKKDSNLICKFRTQLMGGYTRNYFEVGNILEDMVTVEKYQQQIQQVGTRTPVQRTTNVGVGRERR